MTAVIYARYSSDNQREESIEGQIRECTAYAEKNGIMMDRFAAKTRKCLIVGKHKFFIDCQRATLVAAYQFTLFGLIWILHIVCAAFQTSRNRLALVFVQRDQPCRGHPKSPP